MKTLSTMIAALGLLGFTSLTPAVAATGSDIVKGDELSAAKKKAKKSKAKKADLGITEFTSAKKKAKKSKAKKADSIILYRIAA